MPGSFDFRVTRALGARAGALSSAPAALPLLVATSSALLALRLYASQRVGFGDAEALYAAYALHPQPAYLDHPGLIGVAARAIGGGTAPSPARAHLVTAIAATLVPWIMALACRAAGTSWARAYTAALVVAWVPEIAIGLFAMTPDLLLAMAWTGTLALVAAALRAPAGSPRATFAFAGAGLLCGVAAASKVSGGLLILSLLLTLTRRPARAHACTLAPWAGLAAGAFVAVPVVLFEARAGFPMLRHRFVDTQPGAGFSFRNAAALISGQLVYLSPIVAVLAVRAAARAARSAWRDRADAVGTWLAMAIFVPAAWLVPLCLWSRVAEPHWIAPALLALAPAAARADKGPPARRVIAAVALAALMVIAVHVWTLVPSAVRLAPASYDPRLDLTNELYGWPEVTRAVRAEVGRAQTPTDVPGDIVVAAPHWVLCAQLEAALGQGIPVGCDTPFVDDFDGWLPRARWKSAETVVWVTDTRFPSGFASPAFAPQTVVTVPIERAGRVIRTFTIEVWTRRAAS